MSDSKREPGPAESRREFLTLGIGIGIGGLGAALSGAGLFKFMIPVVTYGTPKQFNVPNDALPDKGEELLFPDEKVLVRRNLDGQLGAISLVCTHLGCTVNRVTTGFQCPCHGSQFASDGSVVGGPAPKTLPWHAIRKVPGNRVEIDTGTHLDKDTYFAV